MLRRYYYYRIFANAYRERLGKMSRKPCRLRPSRQARPALFRHVKMSAKRKTLQDSAPNIDADGNGRRYHAQTSA